MSEDEKQERREFSESRDHEALGSERVRREIDQKSGEVTNPSDVPEDGYVMAPTDNNPDRGSDSSSSDSSQE